jgi:hypothetical protein
MSRRVRIERENCCDDLAVAVCGNPLQYARALARLEELRAHAPVVAVAANGGSLLDRVRRIAITSVRADSSDSSSRWAAAIAMLSVVIIALAVPSLPALADRDAKKKEATTKQKKESETSVDVVAEAIARQYADQDEAATAGEPVDEEMDSDDIGVDAEEDAAADGEAAAEDEVDDVDEPGEPSYVPVAVIAPAAAMPVRTAMPVPAIAPTPVLTMTEAAELSAMDRMYAMETDGDDETPRPARPPRVRATSTRKFGTSGKLTVDELIMLRTSGVTPEYIEQMRAVFPDLNLGDSISLRNMGVTAEYLAGMKAAGVSIKDASEATSLRAMGVTVDFVKKLAAAGYTNLTVRELTRLAAAGVNADFIREMAKYRDKN